MKRYIKSEDFSTADIGAKELHAMLLQAVMSWEHKYLSAYGIKEPEDAISNYYKKSGDMSYMTEVLPMLNTFAEKDKSVMDKIVEFNRVNDQL